MPTVLAVQGLGVAEEPARGCTSGLAGQPAQSGRAGVTHQRPHQITNNSTASLAPAKRSSGPTGWAVRVHMLAHALAYPAGDSTSSALLQPTDLAFRGVKTLRNTRIACCGAAGKLRPGGGPQ
jgi:hypothetical protein